MGRAYSLDFRERVVAAGGRCRSVATTFKVSVASVVMVAAIPSDRERSGARREEGFLKSVVQTVRNEMICLCRVRFPMRSCSCSTLFTGYVGKLRLRNIGKRTSIRDIPAVSYIFFRYPT